MLIRQIGGRCVAQGTAMLSNTARLLLVLLVLSAIAYKSFVHTYHVNEGLSFYSGSYVDSHFR
jgi:hypothetical protein